MIIITIVLIIATILLGGYFIGKAAGRISSKTKFRLAYLLLIMAGVFWLIYKVMVAKFDDMRTDAVLTKEFIESLKIIDIGQYATTITIIISFILMWQTAEKTISKMHSK
jgi:heme/copper-type cytochrome/quinol oxidase subunit 2